LKFTAALGCSCILAAAHWQALRLYLFKSCDSICLGLSAAEAAAAGSGRHPTWHIRQLRSCITTDAPVDPNSSHRQ
jgi:hypothetical protein